MIPFTTIVLALESLLDIPFKQIDPKIIEALKKDDLRSARKRANFLYSQQRNSPERQLTYAILLLFDDAETEARKLIEKGLQSPSLSQFYRDSYNIFKLFVDFFTNDETDAQGKRYIVDLLSSPSKPTYAQLLFLDILLYHNILDSVEDILSDNEYDNLVELLFEPIANYTQDLYQTEGSYYELSESLHHSNMPYSFELDLQVTKALLKLGKPNFDLYLHASKLYLIEEEFSHINNLLKKAKKVLLPEEMRLLYRGVKEEAFNAYEFNYFIEVYRKEVGLFIDILEEEAGYLGFSLDTNLELIKDMATTNFIEKSGECLKDIQTLADYEITLGFVEEAKRTITLLKRYGGEQSAISYLNAKGYFLTGDYLQAIHYVNELSSISQYYSEALSIKALSLFYSYDYDALNHLLKDNPDWCSEQDYQTLTDYLKLEIGEGTWGQLIESFSLNKDIISLANLLFSELLLGDLEYIFKLKKHIAEGGYLIVEPAAALIDFAEEVASSMNNPNRDIFSSFSHLDTRFGELLEKGIFFRNSERYRITLYRHWAQALTTEEREYIFSFLLDSEEV